MRMSTPSAPRSRAIPFDDGDTRRSFMPLSFFNHTSHLPELPAVVNCIHEFGTLMPFGKVGVHFIKAGGFGLRLKAGSIGHTANCPDIHLRWYSTTPVHCSRPYTIYINSSLRRRPQSKSTRGVISLDTGLRRHDDLPPNRLLKKFQASARQGTNWRKSAVYTPVHEHFEPICNAVWCRMRVFQQPAKGGAFTDPLSGTLKVAEDLGLEIHRLLSETHDLAHPAAQLHDPALVAVRLSGCHVPALPHGAASLARRTGRHRLHHPI